MAMPETSSPQSLSPEASSERRFGALQRLYGVPGAQRIRQAHVAVVGLGGVGSWSAEALARSGVRRLTLIDMDHIAESNINALDVTTGQSKVLAMQQRIALINPDCQVDMVDEFVSPENWPGLMLQIPDALIDACDQVKAKVALAHWAMVTKVGFITVGAAGGKRMAHKVDIDDLSRITHDPLLAQLRYRLRKHYQAARGDQRMGVSGVFSRDGSLNCHGYGSVVSVTATFGLCAASEILNFLAKPQIKPPN
jgi:tRNA A37 threonylcarbamoyladenosine dehydratase